MHGIYTGYKWQCVEFARRWLLLRKCCTFQDVPCAINIWTDVKNIERVIDGEMFRLKRVPNGSPKPPTKDSLLIYSRNQKMPYGHVAIITDVTDEHVHIAEQNNLFQRWSDDHARKERIIFQNGLYFIEDEDPICGWLEIHDLHQLEPLDSSKVSQILEKYISASE